MEDLVVHPVLENFLGKNWVNPLHWKNQARLLSSLINIDDDDEDDDGDGLLGQGDLLNSGLCLAESPSVYWGRECSRHLSQHIQIHISTCPNQNIFILKKTVRILKGIQPNQKSSIKTF